MKLSAVSKVFALLYTDKMDISRYTNTTNADDTESTKLPANPTYTDVPCRISFASDENSKDSEIDETPVVISPKIFCSLSVDIIAGDFLKVTRYDEAGNVLGVFTGTAGLPTPYLTHKQTNFTMEGSA